MSPRARRGMNTTNREGNNPNSDSEYILLMPTDLEREQGGNPDTKIIEGSNNKQANLVDSQIREDDNSHMTGLNTGELTNQTVNDVQEWLGVLVEVEDDPTVDSYPDPLQLNKTTVLAQLTKLENNRQKGDKRAKEQQDFLIIDELQTKVTGIEIYTQTKGLALHRLINSVYKIILDLTYINKPITLVELHKIRHLT